MFEHIRSMWERIPQRSETGLKDVLMKADTLVSSSDLHQCLYIHVPSSQSCEDRHIAET